MGFIQWFKKQTIYGNIAGDVGSVKGMRGSLGHWEIHIRTLEPKAIAAPQSILLDIIQTSFLSYRKDSVVLTSEEAQQLVGLLKTASKQ